MRRRIDVVLKMAQAAKERAKKAAETSQKAKIDAEETIMKALREFKLPRKPEIALSKLLKMVDAKLILYPGENDTVSCKVEKVSSISKSGGRMSLRSILEKSNMKFDLQRIPEERKQILRVYTDDGEYTIESPLRGMVQAAILDGRILENAKAKELLQKYYPHYFRG